MSPPAGLRRAALLLAAALLAAPGAARAGLESFRSSKHGDPASGPRRDPKYRPGACLQCHGKPEDRAGGRRGRISLFTANDNGLCLACHRAPGGAFPGEVAYQRSTHASSSQVVWPGPKPRARSRADSGRCVNCHDVHGSRDAAGPIPHMLLARGDALCLACHGLTGPGPDVATDLLKVHRHVSTASGAGSQGGALQPACTDCHNPHLVRHEPLATTGATGGLLDGVARVRVANGPAGSAPLLSPVSAEDPSPAREYEVCLRCHAGGATPRPTALGVVGRGSGPLQATPSSAVAVALNPANASYHPVEAPARDLSLDPATFAAGWRADRLVACSDCHGSDGERARGPHGSNLPSMLKRRSPGPGQAEGVRETDLCFQCHAWGAYGGLAPGLAGRASRYAGHLLHSAKGYSCLACHVAHGSTTLPSLLAVRAGGLVAYSRTPLGGTCTTTCHTATPPAASYRITAPR